MLQRLDAMDPARFPDLHLFDPLVSGEARLPVLRRLEAGSRLLLGSPY
jgi:hypothetical protein